MRGAERTVLFLLCVLVGSTASLGEDFRSGDFVVSEAELEQLRSQQPGGIAGPAVLPPGNILQNHGFESGSLPPWETNNWTVTNTDPHTGTYSAEDIGNFWIEQSFTPVDVSLVTSITFWARQPEEAIMAVSLYYGTDDYDQLLVFPTAEWTQFDVTSELRGSGQLETLRLFGYAGGGDDPDLTRIDDAYVEAPIPVELESFEIEK